jgi:hypothetical protein
VSVPVLSSFVHSFPLLDLLEFLNPVLISVSALRCTAIRLLWAFLAQRYPREVRSVLLCNTASTRSARHLAVNRVPCRQSHSKHRSCSRLSSSSSILSSSSTSSPPRDNSRPQSNASISSQSCLKSCPAPTPRSRKAAPSRKNRRLNSLSVILTHIIRNLSAARDDESPRCNSAA